MIAPLPDTAPAHKNEAVKNPGEVSKNIKKDQAGSNTSNAPKPSSIEAQLRSQWAKGISALSGMPAPKRLLMFLAAGSWAGVNATQVQQPRQDVNPFELSREITDPFGALNATAIAERMPKVSHQSMYEAFNYASSCRDLVRERDIENQLRWLSHCMKELGKEHVKLRNPTEREMEVVNTARLKFAQDYEKFLHIIQSASVPGGVTRPSATVFHTDDSTGVQHTVSQLRPKDLNKAQTDHGRDDYIAYSAHLFNRHVDDDLAKHEFTHGHMNALLIQFFSDHPKLSKIYLEAITQFITRHALAPNGEKLAYEWKHNSDGVIRNLLVRANLADQTKNAATEGLRFLQAAYYLLHPEITSKLISAMDEYADQAVKDSKMNSTGNGTMAMSALVGLGLLVILFNALGDER